MKDKITLASRKGFKNRHIDKIPNDVKEIYIVARLDGGESIELCEWTPNPVIDTSGPGKGFLGSARMIRYNFHGVSFRAWEDRDGEFIYYYLNTKT